MNKNPNPGELPSRPNLEQLRKQAKDLKASDKHSTLSDAQLALARQYGFLSWPKLKQAAELRLLRHLIQDGEVEPVRQLLDESPGLINLAFEEGETPLHCAAEENRPAIVELLVQKGADFTLRYASSAHTPLSWALTCWSTDAALKLVELGDKPDLFCAAGLGLMGHLRSFWQDGVLIENASQTGSSRFDDNGIALPRPPESPQDQVSDALYIACRNGQLEASRFLLEKGADPDFRGYSGATCLAWAHFSENQELVDLLIARGASNDVRDQQFGVRTSEFAVMVMASWGFGYKLAEKLKADPSLARLETAYGTPLHAAAEAGNEFIVKLLLAVGADPSVENARGQTAGDLAKAKGLENIVNLLYG